MAPTLYMCIGSPPVRAVLMTAQAIGLKLNEQEIDLDKGEHFSPDFVKLNPQHTVPALKDDNGFVIWDSHAIIAYLVFKYAKDDSLYPRDLQKRAIVDQRLHFDSGVLFAKLRQTCFPIFAQRKHRIGEENIQETIDSYGLLEAILGNNQWAAGDSVTIADYALVSTLSSLDNVIVPVDRKKFPKVAAWLQRVEQLPAYEANREGCEAFANAIARRLKK